MSDELLDGGGSDNIVTAWSIHAFEEEEPKKTLSGARGGGLAFATLEFF